MDLLINFIYFVSEYELLNNKIVPIDANNNSLTYNSLCILGDGWKANFDKLGRFIKMEDNALASNITPFTSPSSIMDDVTAIKDWLQYVGITHYTITANSLSEDIILVDDWEFKFKSDLLESITDLSKLPTQVPNSPYISGTTQAFVSNPPSNSPKVLTLKPFTPIPLFKDDLDDEKKADAPKPKKCTCGKDKHGFASHSNWCDKYEE